MSGTHSLLTVQTKLGALKGKVNVSSDGQEYYAFHGIPFAKPPVGNLRFKAPKPAEPWSGILDATIERDECYSFHQVTRTPVGSEDCLHLNVYTHSTSSNVKKPVMVWIHGGAFVGGSSKTEAYGPDFFMCEDVVLVTVNYRLGIFGFLAFPDKTLGVPGNAGLKDQVMALRWVQENIEYFGGNSNNVTLFGESAGGASVNYLQCSPMAVGLFHKVIIQSGSALNHWARGQILPPNIATHFKMEGKNQKELLEKLMTASMEEILNAQYSCKELNVVSEPRPFSPTIEGYNPYEPSLLLEDPLKIMQSGNYIKVPMIVGFNTHEGMLFEVMHANGKLPLRNDCMMSVPFKYGLQYTSSIRRAISEKIQTFYYGVEKPGSMDSIECLRHLVTDNYFLRGIYEGIRIMLTNNPHPIYFYRFEFEGDLNIFKQMAGITSKGVTHGDDVFYMFKTAISPDVEPSSREAITIQRFIKYWTNFAKTSDPNPAKLDNVFNITWPKTDGTKLINIDDELTVIDLPEIDRMNFWDKIDIITSNKL